MQAEHTQALGADEWRASILSSLPAGLRWQGQALLVDGAAPPRAADFVQFADRVFSAQGFFEGLDYALFAALAFESAAGAAWRSSQGAAPLARDLRLIPAPRRSCYREPRLLGGEAEYLFEPVYIEGEEAPAQLDIDEFIAVMWQKSVRFGLDVAAIAAQLSKGGSARLVIARQRLPENGRDAELKEESRDIHRDNTPRILPNGKMDLSGYRNRFPQLAADVRLLSKQPPVPGKPGFDLHGNLILPPEPADIDLSAIAGSGTRIERIEHIDYLLTARAGFLSIDAASGVFSIEDKIINREGVSARTTGDLVLDGEQYEEHGEIEEKRTLKGKTITVLADVHGMVVSSGGTITLKKNIMGGGAENAHGDIIVEGLASGATLIAHQGTLRVKRAENCLLVGTRIVIDEAVVCDLAGDELRIESAEGCVLAGKTVVISRSASRGGSDMLISMLVPDYQAFAEQARLLDEAISAYQSKAQGLLAQMQAIKAQTELKAYVTVSAQLQRGELTLTPPQMERFRQLSRNVAPALREIASCHAGFEACNGEIAKLQALQEEGVQLLATAKQSIRCEIGVMRNEVLVRSLPVQQAAPPLRRLPPKELRAALRASPPGTVSIFNDLSDEFCWEFDAS